MENRRFTPPEQKNYQYAHEFAYKLAREQLSKIRDIEQQCLRSRAQYQVTSSKKAVIIRYLDQLYKIIFPDIEVSLVDSEEEVTLREKILILHYFTSAKGTPPTNRLITFQDLPAGTVYYPTFLKRTSKPLTEYFGKDPSLLVNAAEKLGSNKVDYGDAAVTINAFSHVPITIVLWEGDDEFPPEGSILFDAGITDYLSTEDVIVLCEIITWKLIRYSRST